MEVSVAQFCPTLGDPMDCIAHQAPLSMGFPSHEYWSGLSFPTAEDLSDQGSNPGLLHCRQILHHLGHQGSLSLSCFGDKSIASCYRLNMCSPQNSHVET